MVFIESLSRSRNHCALSELTVPTLLLHLRTGNDRLARKRTFLLVKGSKLLQFDRATLFDSVSHIDSFCLV